MTTRGTTAVVLIALLISPLCHSQQTMADPDFDARVDAPAYTRDGPRVVIDAAHFNFHTAQGRYGPFAALLRDDGYEVVSGATAFTSEKLATAGVLVIANARGGDKPATAGSPAFTPTECTAVQEWVRNGGALLLIADHSPFGNAVAELAARFGVEMGRGYVFERAQFDADPTILVFSRDNGLLGMHPAIGAARRVVTFTGQALSVPAGAAALLRFGAGASESSDASRSNAHSVAGRAQGVALAYESGRVVIMGEAAMFSAQVLSQPDLPDVRFGMNTPGNDNRLFTLGVMHWLSRYPSSEPAP